MDFTSIPSVPTESGMKYNTYLMLPGMPYETAGVDGLKTGYTDEAQLCLVSKGIFNARRIVTVVTGVAPSSEDASDTRFELTKELIYQFAS